jgi:hypothetical protein
VVLAAANTSTRSAWAGWETVSKKASSTARIGKLQGRKIH